MALIGLQAIASRQVERVIGLTPKILEPRGRQFCVPDRVLNVPVAQVSLQRPRVVALVGQSATAGVPQHVRVSLEAQSRLDTYALNRLRRSLPSTFGPLPDSLIGALAPIRNGPQIDHRNPVNRRERTSSSVTKNSGFI